MILLLVLAAGLLVVGFVAIAATVAAGLLIVFLVLGMLLGLGRIWKDEPNGWPWLLGSFAGAWLWAGVAWATS